MLLHEVFYYVDQNYFDQNIDLNYYDKIHVEIFWERVLVELQRNLEHVNLFDTERRSTKV